MPRRVEKFRDVGFPTCENSARKCVERKKRNSLQNIMVDLLALAKRATITKYKSNLKLSVVRTTK